MQTTKDVLGQMNYAILPISMQHADTPMHRLQTTLDAKTAELATAHQEFAQERVLTFQDIRP